MSFPVFIDLLQVAIFPAITFGRFWILHTHRPMILTKLGDGTSQACPSSRTPSTSSVPACSPPALPPGGPFHDAQCTLALAWPSLSLSVQMNKLPATCCFLQKAYSIILLSFSTDSFKAFLQSSSSITKLDKMYEF